jgi:hypothetical protein
MVFFLMTTKRSKRIMKRTTLPLQGGAFSSTKVAGDGKAATPTAVEFALVSMLANTESLRQGHKNPPQ